MALYTHTKTDSLPAAIWTRDQRYGGEMRATAGIHEILQPIALLSIALAPTVEVALSVP